MKSSAVETRPTAPSSSAGFCSERHLFNLERRDRAVLSSLIHRRQARARRRVNPERGVAHAERLQDSRRHERVEVLLRRPLPQRGRGPWWLRCSGSDVPGSSSSGALVMLTTNCGKPIDRDRTCSRRYSSDVRWLRPEVCSSRSWMVISRDGVASRARAALLHHHVLELGQELRGRIGRGGACLPRPASSPRRRSRPWSSSRSRKSDRSVIGAFDSRLCRPTGSR